VYAVTPLRSHQAVFKDRGKRWQLGEGFDQGTRLPPAWRSRSETDSRG
jgi:hypothetical protein